MVESLPSDFDIFSPVNRSIPLCIQTRANPRPAAHDCARSFSWCGKTRSRPPPWIQNSGPSSFSAIAEHSMCQPGRPRPQGDSHARVLVRLVGLPEREVARILLQRVRLLLLDLIGSLTRQRPVRRERRNAEVDVPVDGVRVTAVDELADERDDLVHRLGDRRVVVDLGQTEATGVLEVPGRSLARHARRRRRARRRRSCR